MKSPFSRPETGGSFLPRDYVAGKTERRTTLTLLVIFTVVMVAIVSAFMVTSQQWNDVRRQQRLIDASYAEEQVKIQQLRELEEQRAELVDKAEVTTALIDRVPRSVLLAEIVTRMPGRVTLLELNLESKRIRAATPPPAAGGAQGRAGGVRSISSTARTNPQNASTARGGRGAAAAAEPARPKVEPPRFESTLTLIGVATVNNDIADFYAALKECPLLEQVDLQFIQATVIDDVDRRKFEIHARIRPDADATLVAGAMPGRVQGLPTAEEIAAMLEGDGAAESEPASGVVPGGDAPVAEVPEPRASAAEPSGGSGSSGPTSLSEVPEPAGAGQPGGGR
ncbi:MAG: PilN domain-containing protein [Thermoleophilia bacterium]|nr:PilN domain-containing protein [Thermoleophilia bacterium]